MTTMWIFYVLSFIISVTSNPISQLVQSSNVCPPTSYSNPTAPVVIQPSSCSPYSQGSTVQVPANYPGPLGETLNQIVLNRILSNPSLQKVIDPNTKLYNQNGDEVQRQVQNTGTPNVINNYFIVPPEFFSLNETAIKNEEDVVDIDQASKRPRRRKLKRRLKKPIEESAGDDELIKTKRNRKRKNNQSNNELKRKRIDDKIESVELIDEREASQGTIRDQESKRKPKHRSRKKKKEEIASAPDESIEDDSNELEDRSSVISIREKKIKTPQKSKLNSKHIDKEMHGIKLVEPEPLTEKRKTVRDKGREEGDVIESPKKRRKHKRLKPSVKNSEDKTLKNIEFPTDISNRVTQENRPTRDSNRNEAKRNPEKKGTNNVKKVPSPNMSPFPDDVLKNFFPYMPMGGFNNPHSNYPPDFDHYYRYLDPVRNSNANKNKKKPKIQNIQNRKSNGAKSNTHTIEIKLKPKNKENTTEPVVTTEASDHTETPVTTETSITTETPVTTETPATTETSKYVHEITLSVEDEPSTESIEEITVIPMEMPHKVTPLIEYDEESSSKEHYETFSKLEDLHDFIMPELGTEDEVHPICDNGIFNEYYPVFHNDVYYDPDVENVNHLDDRYFYKTENEDTIDRERRKLDRYEDARYSIRDNEKDIESTDPKTKKNDRDINKFNHNEYLDHISTFADTESLEKVKPNDEIRRVKVPSKNTRAKTESVETVFAGSKVAKYGVPIDATHYSSAPADECSSSSERTSYVFAKSIGHPEDYW